jgi:phosphatidate cytidylyltransferase
VPLLYGAYHAIELPFVAVSIFALALVWWCFALGWVVRFQRGVEVKPLRTRFAQAATGCVVVLPPWVALVCLHRLETAGPSLVLFLLALIWAADSGAYLAGRYLGASRLASRVSPGKSWAGVVGGLVCVAVLAVVAGQLLGFASAHTVVFVLLSLVTGLVSILGDLVESLFKRLAGVKDSGAMLPGHGGVLDRIDSLTSAAPFFALGILTLGTQG